MQGRQKSRQRIRRDELVRFVFAMFSQYYERSSVDSIHDIRIPVADVRRRLSEQYDTEYSNDWWIVTQLHRYEREAGIRLFERVEMDRDPDSIVLAIYRDFDGFRQRQHVLANQKIRIANGILGLVDYTAAREERPTVLYLGSGSILSTFAEVLTHHVAGRNGRYRIFSHNLAVQEKIVSAAEEGAPVEFHSVGGRVDATMYISLTNDIADAVGEPLDFVIQSTNAIRDGVLHVADRGEAEMKGAILHTLSGTRILAVVKDEFSRSAAGKHPYGTLEDYDYIVTIPSRDGTDRAADEYFRTHADVYHPHVFHWSYTVLRVGTDEPAEHRVTLPVRSRVPEMIETR